MELRKIYFSLLNRIFCDALDPTESIEEFLKQVLGEKTRVEQIHPPPYFMCTTTRVDVEPGQVKLVRYVETLVASDCSKFVHRYTVEVIQLFWTSDN